MNIIHAFNTTELYTYKWLMSVAQFSSVQSLGCVQLFCDPMDCSPPASSVQGILQARILEWLAVCYSRRSSQPWNPTQVSCMADRFFTSEPPGTLQVVKMVNFMSSVSCHNQKHYLKSSHISPFDQAPISHSTRSLHLIYILNFIVYFKKMFIYLLIWLCWALVAAPGIFKLCCSMLDF